MLSTAYRCRRSARDRSSGSGHHYYGGDGNWYSKSGLESRYSDFVPYDYDDRTLVTRILQAFNYARSSILHTGSSTILTKPASLASTTNSSRTLCGFDDIEMLTSSPSPTLHGTNSSQSPSSYRGSYRSSRPSKSPNAFIKPPPAAAFPKAPAPTPTSHKRPLSQTYHSPRNTTRDASTQYTPAQTPNEPMVGKKRGTPDASQPSDPPPEPDLRPQTASAPGKNSLQSSPSTIKAAPPSSTTSVSRDKSSSSSSSITSAHDASTSSPKRPRAAKPAVKLMPAAYETCDTKDLVILISSMLLELIRHNDEIPLQDGRLTRFHSRAPPGISVKDYLQRLTTHATLAPPILLSMVYYIDRLCSLYPAFTISSLTVHRFLITAATVASKGLSDSFWTNNTYARVGGVSMKELALLELEFLWRVEWRIVPKPEVLGDYYRSLVERSDGFAIEETKKSGRRSRSGSKESQKSNSGEAALSSVSSGSGSAGGSADAGSSSKEMMEGVDRVKGEEKADEPMAST